MKHRIRELLYQKGGEYVSGQAISQQLGISRTAVWKHIQTLQKEGYAIESIRNKGYRLIMQETQLMPESVKSFLETRWLGQPLVVMDTVDSTNTWARKHIHQLEHGAVVVAEEQTAGKGRRGKEWKSVKGEGLWCTLVLRPEIAMQEGGRMTLLAAAALLQAIQQVTGVSVKIKWPNDLVVEDRKMCGILAEMAGELSRVEYMLVGVGINVNQQRFPEELAETATSLFMQTNQVTSRHRLLASFLNFFEAHYDCWINEQSYQPVLELVRKASSLINHPIYVIRGDERIKGRAVAISDDGGLEVVYEDGTREVLMGGEVSVRKKMERANENTNH